MMITICIPTIIADITINENETRFQVTFGLCFINAIIKEKESFGNVSVYHCQPVEKVAAIGLGTYYTEGNPERNIRFFRTTFTNASSLSFSSTKNFKISDEHQHITLLSTLHNDMCGFTLE
ncbi:MAG: hypothetical protein V1769_02970 [Thermoplasmatota archaeon]